MTPRAVSDNTTVRMHQHAACHHLSSSMIHRRTVKQMAQHTQIDYPKSPTHNIDIIGKMPTINLQYVGLPQYK